MAQNHLIHETSPYLLQHAHNPVDWYPWCEEALQKAKQENKPIFLSIGYSSCHWCHVMEHESFENEEIAKIMNENFVNIKVDREERPDLDDIYQKACQMATGQGGWPLSVFLTPDQKPFYVGTYFPILDSYGRPGFGSILLQLAQAWKEKPQDVKKAAENFMVNLQGADLVPTPTKLEKSILDEAAVNLFQIADNTYGGFGSAPKFPNSSNLSFLLRYSKISKMSRFSEFVLKTLNKMARGGIFDQIGGGFHRYSTDARWLVPHFEKMLYDNALLPIVYAEAYQITNDQFYLDVIKKTLDFVLREMTSPRGGFYSALDADSEGEEGKYYVWSKKEIQEILGSDSDVFCLYYDVTDGGNYEGKTILNNNVAASTIAFHFGISEDKVRQLVEEGSKKLLEIRSKRARPALDDKILTSWNALMVSAFAKSYQVTDEKKYLKAAQNCLEFIEKNLISGTQVMRTYKNGHAKLNGYLEDYSYLINALIDVFEVTAEPKYLDLATNLANHTIDHFWDEKNNSFYFTADNHESLIIRPKSNYDLSMPSGNSVAANVLLKLYHLTQQQRFLEISVKTMETFALAVAENPFGFGYLLNTIYLYLEKPTEITLLNLVNKKMVDSVTKKFLPEAIVVTVPTADKLTKLSKYPFFAGKEFTDETTVFICKNFNCSLPLKTTQEIEQLLG
ncbi:MAG: thioredoxin domain-containing protein [Candidatus Nitrosotenuis sp.]